MSRQDSQNGKVRPDAGKIVAINRQGALYPVEKLRAHRLGLQHLAISVFVFCGERLLLQRRAPGKYHSALLWANTCCSHPQWGESAETCAQRRLAEELGIHLSLQAAGHLDYVARVGPGMVENERVSFFVGELEQDRLNVTPDLGEAIEVCWMPVSELRRDIDVNPSAYARWLKIYLDRAPETGISELIAPRGDRLTNT